MLLYRPVGLRELELIAEAGFRAFPPRLEHQPIFYPVLSFEYAERIARDWNTKDAASGYCGFVTRFEVRTVGSSAHEELWVPAGQLDHFNRRIRGRIELVAHYYGEQFSELLDPESGLPEQIEGPCFLRGAELLPFGLGGQPDDRRASMDAVPPPSGGDRARRTYPRTASRYPAPLRS